MSLLDELYWALRTYPCRCVWGPWTQGGREVKELCPRCVAISHYEADHGVLPS